MHGPSPSDGPLLKLRRDLRPALNRSDGQVHYIIEDPLKNHYFRLSPEEWDFACRLDGSTSVRQAAEQTAARFGEERFGFERAQLLGPWLLRNGLTQTARAHDTQPLSSPSWAGFISALFFTRIPLIYPDRVLSRIFPRMRWCFSRWAYFGWILLVLCGVTAVLGQLERFLNSAQVYLSGNNWVYLIFVWLGLKVVHEFFHGLACKHFGGSVGACGVALILFSPVAFVDVSSAWKFPNKWQRIMTSAAGLYVELAVAAVAAIVWSQTESPAMQFVCHAIVLAAAVSSIIFNANPLMRFDGYYMLSDFVEIQNLASESRQETRVWLRRWLFDLPSNDRPTNVRRGQFLLLYGIAAGLWRPVVSLSLLLAAARMFHGAGLALAIVAALLWLILPTVKFASYVWRGTNSEAPNRLRFATAVLLCGGIGSAVLGLPLPGGVRAPVIVDFEPLYELRPESPGFVSRVYVNGGDRVQAGQSLLELRNDQLEAELELVSIDIRQSTIRMRILREQGRVAESQTEESHRETLVERLQVLKQRFASLTITAPADGVILSNRPQEWLGRFVEAGTPLVSVAAEADKQINVSIPDYHLEAFLNRVGSYAWVRLNSRSQPIDDAVLISVDPTASDTLSYPLLGSHNGGPLPIIADLGADDDRRTDYNRVRLTSPRFHGVVHVKSEMATELRSGQVGELRFTDVSENLGRRLYRLSAAWLARRR